MSESPFLSEFLALYEEGGAAHAIRKAAETALVRGVGPCDPHEIGRLRGVIQGLDALRDRLQAEHAHKRTAPPEASSSGGNRRPLRRVL